MDLEDRISTAELQPWFQQILKLSKLQNHPQVVFKFISKEVGISRSTIYKYYTQDVKNAPASLEEDLKEIKSKLENGFTIDYRVSTEKIAAMLRIIARLSKLQRRPNELYRFVAEMLGVHRTCVVNYAKQKKKTAPTSVLRDLTELKGRLEEGFKIVPATDGMYIEVKELVAAYKKVQSVYKITSGYPDRVEMLDNIICEKCSIRHYDFKMKLRHNRTKRVKNRELVRFLTNIADKVRMQRSTTQYYKDGDLLCDNGDLGIVDNSNEWYYTVKFIKGYELISVQMCFNGGRVPSKDYNLLGVPIARIGNQ